MISKEEALDQHYTEHEKYKEKILRHYQEMMVQQMSNPRIMGFVGPQKAAECEGASGE